MNDIFLSAAFTEEDLAYQIAECFDWKDEPMVGFITLLDAEMADTGFTIRLIEALADAYAEATNTVVHINIMENSK